MNTPKCTPGHEASCQTAISPVCTCNCQGVLHQVLLKQAPLSTPAEHLVVVCGLCGLPAGYSLTANKWMHKDSPYSDAMHKVDPQKRLG